MPSAAYLGAPFPLPPPSLMPAEYRALRAYLATGRIKLAAALLGLSPSTVKNQLASGRQRAGVDSTAQLIAIYGFRL